MRFKSARYREEEVADLADPPVRAIHASGAVRWFLPFTVAVGIAMLARLLFGPSNVGYDAVYALVWGSDLASGRLPDFGVSIAPTSHPLANAWGFAVAPFWDGAMVLTAYAVALAYGYIGWLSGRLAWLCSGRSLVVAFVASVIVLSRPALVEGLMDCSMDLVFVVFVLGAAVSFTKGSSAQAVLSWLVLAGLVRPEAWLISIGVLAWFHFTNRAGGAERNMVFLAVAAPVIWATFDLLLTGNPLHSFELTRSLAEELDRRRSASTGLRVLPSFILGLAGTWIAWLGALGALAVSWLAPERWMAPLALLAFGLIGFLVLGASGLPLINRYALIPAVMLCLFAAATLTIWRETDSQPLSVLLGSLAAFAVLVIVLSFPSNAAVVERVSKFSNQRSSMTTDLTNLVRNPLVKQALARCKSLSVSTHRPVPVLALILDESPRRFPIANSQGDSGLYLRPANERVARHFMFNAGPLTAGSQSQPSSSSREIASNRSWVVVETECIDD